MSLDAPAKTESRIIRTQALMSAFTSGQTSLSSLHIFIWFKPGQAN